MPHIIQHHFQALQKQSPPLPHLRCLQAVSLPLETQTAGSQDPSRLCQRPPLLRLAGQRVVLPGTSQRPPPLQRLHKLQHQRNIIVKDRPDCRRPVVYQCVGVDTVHHLDLAFLTQSICSEAQMTGSSSFVVMSVQFCVRYAETPLCGASENGVLSGISV